MKNEYPLSTVILATFLGFTIGFLACYQVLDGSSRNDIPTMLKRINNE